MGTDLSLPLSLVKKPVEDLYELAKGAVKQKLGRLRTDARLRSLYKAITAVQKVKTIWQVDKEVKLLSFYYPSKVLIGKDKKTINAISEIATDHNFVVQGTVGQGKSIFLRFLCIKELAKSARVPIFVELRRYQSGKTFHQFLIDVLRMYGFPADEGVFTYLAESGKLVLLLDGFDEIEPQLITSVIHDLEAFSHQFEKLQIIVTSRPDSGIERSPHFRVYKLAPLEPSDHKHFLEKVIDDEDKINDILAAISRSSAQIRDLLKTPLLLTLLVIVYNADQEIPGTLSAFYDVLFQTLLTRHDKTKPGFSRKRATKLANDDLKRLFEAFCYAARQMHLLSLTQDQLSACLTQACKVTGVATKPELFATDITKIACLMQEEGFKFHFTHKSVAEFHAASFIRHAPNETAIKFYSKLHSDKWMYWQQELVFLSHIDRVRYLRHFLVPLAQAALQEFGVSRKNVLEGLSVSTTKAILDRHWVTYTQPSRSRREISGISLTKPLNMFTHNAEMDYLTLAAGVVIGEQKAKPIGLVFKAVDYPEESTAQKRPLGDLMADLNRSTELSKAVSQSINRLVTSLTEAETYIAREESKESFVDP
jgi:hypothetical protein